MAHAQIAVFARLAKENAQPTRLIYGQKTLLSRTMHDIRYDSVNDEILVTNPFALAILVFRGAADGQEAPIRVIQGPDTELHQGLPDRLDVDPVHNEIFVPSGDRILVYPRTGRGNVAPIRTIKGANTQLRSVQSLAVDPVNNLIIAGTNGPWREGGGALIIFNRTDNGNVKPKAIIHGPKTEIYRINQIQVYSPKGWIVATSPGVIRDLEPKNVFVGVWHIGDNGDVPPRWKIGGPKSTLKKPRGVAVNAKHKELMIADMRLNSVLTYYFPELF